MKREDTGYRDKNGKNIYVGDILETEWNQNYYCGECFQVTKYRKPKITKGKVVKRNLNLVNDKFSSVEFNDLPGRYYLSGLHHCSRVVGDINE